MTSWMMIIRINENWMKNWNLFILRLTIVIGVEQILPAVFFYI